MAKRFLLMWLIFYFSISLQVFSQNTKVYDVFHNLDYSYAQKYKEVKDYELNLSGEIDISYFAMRNENGLNFDKLNQSIEKMALHSWKNEQGKFELNKRVKVEVALYNEFRNRNNHRNKQDISNDFSSDLKSIDINFLSVCNNIISFNQNYTFIVRSKSQNINNNEVNIYITNYYTVDVFGQNVNEMPSRFNESQVKELEQILLPVAGAYFDELKNLYLQNYNEEPEYADETEDDEIEIKPLVVKNTNNAAKSIFFEEADYYWLGWGLMIHFPIYSKSSRIINGEAITIFVPLNKCKTLLHLFPDYSSFAQIPTPAHQFRNFDYFNLLNNYNKFRHEPSVTSLFALNNANDKPSKLTVGSYQTFKNNTKNYRGDFVYEFNKNTNNFPKYASNKSYDYFLEKSENKTKRKENNQASSKLEEVYDEKGNLILRKNKENDRGGDYYFFYNNQTCYLFKTTNRDVPGDEALEKLSLIGEELCLSDVCLTFNKSMQVIAIKSLKYQFNDVEIGFDEKGRIVEAHTENDRYNYYYEYDAFDRLVKYSTFEFQRATVEVEYFYKPQERLPYLQKKHTYNNEVFEEETYDWE